MLPFSYINLANPVYFLEIKTKEFLRKMFNLKKLSIFEIIHMMNYQNV